jgi:hypothetical protein
MKKLLLASSLFLTAAVSAFAADSTHSSADVMVTLSSNAFARIGMSREHLVAQLGEPSEELSATVWVYWDFRAVGRPAGDRSDALVVVLNNDQISLLRLTERSLVEAARLKLRANAARTSVVAGK